MAKMDPNNVTEYWWDPAISGLSLMCADFKTLEYPLHVHDAYVIAATEQGGAIIQSHGINELADTSSLFVFNPAEPQASQMGRSNRWRYRSVYLTQFGIDEVTSGLGVEDIPYFPQSMLGDTDLTAMFLSLHKAFENGVDEFRRRELLFCLFAELFSRYGSDENKIQTIDADGPLLLQAMDLMSDQYSVSLSLQDLAAVIGLTPFQLIRLFKRSVGMSPHAYLTQVRLGRACQFLRRGLSIADVAVRCGFYDQSALTKHFKRSYGITPRQLTRAAFLKLEP
ncbi:MAG: AraC family transcriptional regulator [Sneathiella sp.]